MNWFTYHFQHLHYLHVEFFSNKDGRKPEKYVADKPV